MSDTEDVRTLWRHCQATALLLGSELAIKLLLHFSGEFFLGTQALALVSLALTWFTVATVILFVVCCFTTLVLMHCEGLVKALSSLRRTWRAHREEGTAFRTPSVVTTVVSTQTGTPPPSVTEL